MTSRTTAALAVIGLVLTGVAVAWATPRGADIPPAEAGTEWRPSGPAEAPASDPARASTGHPAGAADPGY